MISSIKGILEDIGIDWADVLLGGVTIRVNIPPSAIEGIGQIGETIRLLTSLQVREDSLTLYGFPTNEARLAFDSLLSVNGVGPRVALNVLSRLTPDSLAAAVESGDTGAFTGVSGVGKKTASRIVLELKGKLNMNWTISSDLDGNTDAIEALAALGYTLFESREVLSTLPSGKSMSLEEKIRLALKRMGGT